MFQIPASRICNRDTLDCKPHQRNLSTGTAQDWSTRGWPKGVISCDCLGHSITDLGALCWCSKAAFGLSRKRCSDRLEVPCGEGTGAGVNVALEPFIDYPLLDWSRGWEERGPARTEQDPRPKDRATIFHFLLTRVEVHLRERESWALLAGKAGEVPSLLSGQLSGDGGDMEAKSQTGLDTYPQANLSHGVFENFCCTGCSRLSGGVECFCFWCKLVKRLSQFQPNSTQEKLHLHLFW